MTEIERLKKRLTAAFLLLNLCPECGKKCEISYVIKNKMYFRVLRCLIHGSVWEGFMIDLWASLEKQDGV